MSSITGYTKCNALKIWKARQELYVGHVNGVINVYSFDTSMSKLTLTASFQMHKAAIHSIYILNDLKFAITSGFDSSLNLWKPPAIWEKKMIVTQSMVKVYNPNEDLATIREEPEPDTFAIKRKISALDDKEFGNAPPTDVFQALLDSPYF